MVSVLIQSLLLASGGIVSVGSITIVILLLISDQGWRNGLAYSIGYVGGYTLIGVAVILVGGNTVGDTTGSGVGGGGLVSSILLVLLGTLLLWVTLRNWRKPPAENAQSFRLFTIVDGLSTSKALAFGAAVTVINVKNLAIFLSAISVPLLSPLPLPVKLGILLLDVIVFCASVIVPVLIYVTFPQQAEERLNWLKQTLEAHSRPIGIWAPFLFGLIFLTRGVIGLL